MCSSDLNTNTGGVSTILQTTVIYTGTLSDYFNKDLKPYIFDGLTEVPAPFDMGLVFGVVGTTNNLSRDNCSTRIIGSVINQATNLGVGGISLVYENWQVIQTQSDGTFSLICWGDMVTPNLPYLPIKTIGTIKMFQDRKSTRLNSSHSQQSRMPSSA